MTDYKAQAATSVFANPNNNRGVADQARHYHATSWAAKLRGLSFSVRMGIIFTGAFSLGFAIEAFAAKTGLYKTVVHNKTERRIKLDEQVLEFRENMKKWQEEDMKIAAEKAARDAGAAGALQK